MRPTSRLPENREEGGIKTPKSRVELRNSRERGKRSKFNELFSLSLSLLFYFLYPRSNINFFFFSFYSLNESFDQLFSYSIFQNNNSVTSYYYFLFSFLLIDFLSSFKAENFPKIVLIVFFFFCSLTSFQFFRLVSFLSLL